MTIVPLGEARDHLSELLSEVERTHDRVTVTRHGKPIAVLLSPDDLESLEETIDILSTPGALEAIKEGQAELAAGKGIPLDEIRVELGLK